MTVCLASVPSSMKEGKLLGKKREYNKGVLLKLMGDLKNTSIFETI